MGDASEYVGWLFLGTISFVVLSLAYEGVKRMFFTPKESKQHASQE